MIAPAPSRPFVVNYDKRVVVEGDWTGDVEIIFTPSSRHDSCIDRKSEIVRLDADTISVDDPFIVKVVRCDDGGPETESDGRWRKSMPGPYRP
jgi:hypothetical protein